MASDHSPEAKAWWDAYQRQVRAFWQENPIPPSRRSDHLIAEFQRAAAAGDSDRIDLLVDVALWPEVSPGLDALHRLLALPGHRRHQQIVRSLQLAADPDSLPFLRRAFDEDLQVMQDGSCSSFGAIAKWFSHAFADIGTPDAIAALRHYALSHPEPEVREEMRYRLDRLSLQPGN
ncbi:hypothetical protein K4L06_03665 [Lysobacter sp. BMK333-48F3]|uniref:hypothetical protein n=1 Tax=Lysobacter sp. BMK333-48F3 TaxID=2867962 RepID=UPI001C8CE0D4|nr:hypothetical protein [Lysobacter sp. BMK333-48F3]MBX9400395.1 hypothetical protein [Lysobacter sp. BMK333-48F3]